MEKSQIFIIIFVILIVCIASFITIKLSTSKVTSTVNSILEKSLQCAPPSDNFASSTNENGDAYCNSLGKKCLIAERQIKLSRYLDDSKSQMYLTDAYSQTMGCGVSFKNFDEKSEVVSGDDPELFVNVEFNVICCG